MTYPFKRIGVNANRTLISFAQPSLGVSLGSQINGSGTLALNSDGSIENVSNQTVIGAYGIDMSAATGGSSGAPIYNNTTNPDNILDTGGGSAEPLGNSANWGAVSGTPTTIDGYGIVDAQTALGPASGTQILSQTDNDGTVWIDRYGPELNGYGGTSGATYNLSTTAGTYIQVGDSVLIQNPGPDCFLLMGVMGYFGPGTTAATEYIWYFNFSKNGGTSYSSTDIWASTTDTVGGFLSFGTTVGLALSGITGDIIVNLQASAITHPSPASKVGSFYIWALALPNSMGALVTGSLAATIPSTATGACSATYPTTTCTASANVSVSITGGVPPYSLSSYGWTVVSGSGTITDSTSITCTVSQSHATADGGTTQNTVVKCKVEDAASTTATSGNCTVGLTFTRTYSPVTATVSFAPTAPTCTGKVSCMTTCSATVHPAGGTGSWSSYAWTRTVGDATLTDSTSNPCSLSYTHATPYSDNNTLSCLVTDSDSHTGTGSNTVVLTGNST